MLKTAEVISTDGKLAVVKSERSAMCDGCHKSSCGSSCAMGAIMGTDKSVTVTALNKAGAEKGDTVELESSDRIILTYALVVFILPIVVCALLYAAGTSLFDGERIPVLLAVIGFMLTFVGIGFFEKLRRGKEPDVVIVRVIKKSESEADA